MRRWFNCIIVHKHGKWRSRSRYYTRGVSKNGELSRSILFDMRWWLASIASSWIQAVKCVLSVFAESMKGSNRELSLYDRRCFVINQSACNACIEGHILIKRSREQVYLEFAFGKAIEHDRIWSRAFGHLPTKKESKESQSKGYDCRSDNGRINIKWKYRET